MSKKNLQLTIDFLLNKSDNYFCMKWVKRDEPDEYPYYSSERIKDCNFSYGFSNKLTHIPTLLSGDIKNRKDKLLIELDQPKEIPIYSNIHFLKSHLQKCIRLKKTNLAIPTAKHLLDLDPSQFLRRLSIIFVEDTMITQHYSVIVWLMVAVSSGKFILQLNHIEFLLGLVHIACQCQWKESYNIPEEYDKMSNEKLAKYILDQISPLDKYQQGVIQSLLIRSSFGGLIGDTKMLLNAAFVWIKRFQSGDDNWRKYYYSPLRTISGSVLPLDKNDWVLSAIDFHCFPKMLDWIKDEMEDISDEDLKSIIWHCSSKTNYRKNYDGMDDLPITEYQKTQWQLIRKQVYSIAKYAVKNYS